MAANKEKLTRKIDHPKQKTMQKTTQPTTKRTRTATQARHLRPDSPRPDSPRHPPRRPRGNADGTTAIPVPTEKEHLVTLAEEEPPHKRARKEEEGESSSSSSGGHSASPTHAATVKRILNEFKELASSALDPIKKLLAEKMRMKNLLAEKEKELEATRSRLKALEADIRSTQASIDSAGVRIAGTI